ncbi:MAG: BofC C-terminal domain-containing protein [Bacillota bacterium]
MIICPYKRFILLLIIVVMVAAVGTYLVLDLSGTEKENTNLKFNSKQEFNAQEEGLAALIAQKRREFESRLLETELQLGSDLSFYPTLVFKTYYTECGDVTTEYKQIEYEFELTDLTAKYPKWELVTYNQRLIIFERKVKTVCPKHRKKLYLGIKDGRVAIFYGHPKSQVSTLQRKTEILIEPLPPKEVADLRAGIKIASQRELLMILEGLGSMQDEEFK